MKRLDDDKVRFVEFLRSIRFARQADTANTGNECPTRFAHLQQRVGDRRRFSTEDSQLVRSAN